MNRAWQTISEGIAEEAVDGERFIAERNELAEDGIANIPRLDFLGEAPRKTYRKCWVEQQKFPIRFADAAKTYNAANRG